MEYLRWLISRSDVHASRVLILNSFCHQLNQIVLNHGSKVEISNSYTSPVQFSKETACSIHHAVLQRHAVAQYDGQTGHQ